MIQFNLLPDVKLEYIRTRKTKQTVMTISVLVTAISVGLALLLFVVVSVVQRTHLRNLDQDIERISQEIREVSDLDKILTVQNQLDNITPLHDDKPVATRLADYITQITPSDITIAELEVDFANETILFTGAASSLKSINEFVDTMKFTDYQAGEGEAAEKGRAFSNVVLVKFGRDDRGASYEISLNFNPAIFSSESDVVFTVPKITTTRSVTDKPRPLFEPLSDPEEEEE